jgi:hypothetical protein
MKFLCVPCDTPMKLTSAAPPERGSLAVEYECPECFHTMAMLTNPMETQMVTSLGVKIGPGQGGSMASGAAGDQTAARAAGAAPPADSAAGSDPDGEGSGCPFSGMVNEMAAAEPGSDGLTWTVAAEKRLQNIPSFVRTMARKGIDKYAREKGLTQVDDTLLDEAKEFFGM